MPIATITHFDCILSEITLLPPVEISRDVILSVHIPKTAGMTLFNMFQNSFGRHAVMDYPDRTPWEDVEEPVTIIHGHFELHRYLGLAPNPRVMTFLRDPLERAISHYYFWKSPPPHIPLDHPIFLKYFVERKPSLEDFILAPEMANIMTAFLLPYTRPEQFFFIGFVESIDRDIASLRTLIGLENEIQPRCNPGPEKDEGDVSASVKRAFYKLHHTDMDFYRRALALRDSPKGPKSNWLSRLSGRLWPGRS